MTSAYFAPLLIAFVGGYVLGSSPFGLLLTRAAGLGDIRNVGSGNIGATNVLRTGNKGLAAATLLLDVLKGTAAVYFGWLIIDALTTVPEEPEAVMSAGAPAIIYTVAGIAAFLGHLFPVWLCFKGGKGVATYIGVLLGLAWKLALVFCALWLIVAVLSRYSSLSALVASLAVPVVAYVLAGPLVAVATALMTALLVWKHAANISRLLAGEEPRIGSNA